MTNTLEKKAEGSITNIPCLDDTIGSHTVVCITWILGLTISGSVGLGWSPQDYISNWLPDATASGVEESTVRTISADAKLLKGVCAGKYSPWQWSWTKPVMHRIRSSCLLVPCMGEGNVLNDLSLENPCLREKDFFFSHTVNGISSDIGWERDTEIATEGVPATNEQARTLWIRTVAPKCPRILCFIYRGQPVIIGSLLFLIHSWEKIVITIKIEKIVTTIKA